MKRVSRWRVALCGAVVYAGGVGCVFADWLPAALFLAALGGVVLAAATLE